MYIGLHHCFNVCECVLVPVLLLSFYGPSWSDTNKKQDAQLSQRDRAAGYISFVRKWKTGTQRQYFTDIVSLASTTVTQSYRIR